MTDPQYSKLEDEAQSIRDRFARTLAALDKRRHEMFNFGFQAKRHAKPLSLTGVGVIVATGVGIALLVRRRHNTPEYKLRQAWSQTRKALDRTVDHSIDVFNDNMAGLKKQWKKSVPKDLREMF